MITGGTMPDITTAMRFPPPATANLDPHPLAFRRIRTTPETTHVRPLATIDSQRREHEGVFLVVVRDAFAHDDQRIVDRFRDCQHFEATSPDITQAVEIKHLAVDVKKGVHGAVGCGGKSDGMAGCIDSECAALIATECSHVGYALVGLQKCVGGGPLDVAGAGHVREIIVVAGAARAAERSEILHFAIFKEKGVAAAVGSLGEPNHMTGVIDAIGRAGSATESAQIGNGVGQLRLRWSGN